MSLWGSHACALLPADAPVEEIARALLGPIVNGQLIVHPELGTSRDRQPQLEWPIGLHVQVSRQLHRPRWGEPSGDEVVELDPGVVQDVLSEGFACGLTRGIIGEERRCPSGLAR